MKYYILKNEWFMNYGCVSGLIDEANPAPEWSETFKTKKELTKRLKEIEKADKKAIKEEIENSLSID